MAHIDIDSLIKIVTKGGKITTGVDIYSDKGILLLDKGFLVTNANTLEKIKENGVQSIPFSPDGNSGIWDAEGRLLLSKESSIPVEKQTSESISSQDSYSGFVDSTLEKHLHQIEENKKIAAENYTQAKQCIKKALTDIKKTGGQFDYDEVSSHVSHLAEFLTVKENPFSYLTKEILSHDDYLYNHSINVCTVGTTILNKFNDTFSSMINKVINTGNKDDFDPLDHHPEKKHTHYRHFQKDELESISLGFFLHDIGKVLVPDDILNKAGKLSDDEFTTVKKHSYEYGLSILEKNNIKNPFITNIIKYHHSPLYSEEDRCYPDVKSGELPIYTKICKFADIYDAMTSKRSYKEAINQINVVTGIFRTYAKKDNLLQHILHAFIKSIGIYPPGSIVFLRNGQMAYVLDSNGPFIIPFTNNKGESLKGKPDPIDLNDEELDDSLKIDNRKNIKKPREVYDLLPSFLKTVQPEK